MGIWSSIRDFWSRHGRPVSRYGSGAMLFFSALMLGRYAAACVILAGVLILYAVEHWWEDYRLHGEMVMRERKQRQEEMRKDFLEALRARFGLSRPKPRAVVPAEEADASPEESKPAWEPPPEPPKPSVTHET